MKVFSTATQKGGTGKTTTAATLYAGLILKGFKVLAIDLDPQANLSYSLNADPEHKSALSLLTGEAKISECMQPQGDSSIISASNALAGADVFMTDTGKEYRLREAIESLENAFDYVVIDTPPQLGVLTVNALTASDSVIIPAQADIFSLQGLDQLTRTIDPIKKYCNKELSIAGILLTRYNARTSLSRDILAYTQKLADSLQTKVFNARIRESVTVKEAQLNRQSLFEYAPKANVTADYAAFIDELTGE